MNFKVKKHIIYKGVVYNPNETVDILETDVIERVKKLDLVFMEEENIDGVTTEKENTDVEVVEKENKNVKSKKA